MLLRKSKERACEMRVFNLRFPSHEESLYSHEVANTNSHGRKPVEKWTAPCQARRPRAAGNAANCCAMTRAALLVFLLIGFLLVVSFPTTSAAQHLSDEQAVEAAERELRGQPWYDREAQDLKRITVRPSHDVTNRLSRWEAAPPQTWGPWNLPQWILRILEVLAWCALIALLGACMYFLIRWFARFEADVPSASGTNLGAATSEATRIEELPFQLKHPQSDLLGESRRHYDAGRFDEAMVYLYSYQLVQLDKRHWIRLSRGKTNRQYLREVRRAGGPHDLLEDSVVAFEDVFFGRHTLSRKRFETCWNRLDEFHAAMHCEEVPG